MSMLFLSLLLLFCFLGCCCSDFWCFVVVIVVVIIVVPAIHELLNATTLFVLNVVPCSSAPMVTHWFTFQMILLRWKLSLSINKDNPAFAFPPVSPPNKILPDCFSFGQLVTSYPVSVKGIWDVTMMWWYVFPLLFLLPSSVSFSVSVPCFCFGQLVAFYPLCVNWIWDVDMMMPFPRVRLQSGSEGRFRKGVPTHFKSNNLII